LHNLHPARRLRGRPRLWCMEITAPLVSGQHTQGE
jgi:hypothetical protein